MAHSSNSRNFHCFISGKDDNGNDINTCIEFFRDEYNSSKEIVNFLESEGYTINKIECNNDINIESDSDSSSNSYYLKINILFLLLILL